MVPLHLSNHWCLVAVDVTYHKITLHDSLANNNLHCMDIIEQYQATPQLLNSVIFKTGIYVCMNGCNIAEPSMFKFYLDISRTRKHMERELLCSKLLNW